MTKTSCQASARSPATSPSINIAVTTLLTLHVGTETESG